MAEESTPPSRSARRGEGPGRRQQPPPAPGPGTRVAGYEVEARLGAGGYGTVYRARAGTSRVALKFLPLESSGGWEEREVDVLRRLKHPHVVRLLGYVDWPEDEPGFRVLLMEYVDGLPLDEWARRHNPSPLEVVELLLALLEALEAVHASGVVHRDVKASNILVRASDGQPVLVDFGAGAYTGAPTLTTSVLPPGTPEYRSPEAWDFFRRHVGEAGVRYEPTPADDLWAVGIQLYWVLTDRLPFTGRDFLAIGTAVLNEQPVPPREHNPWVPEALGRVCLRMLEKSPGARYADAREVHAVLSALKAKADASWHEPLFEPHAPHNATTGPMGRLAEGQDLLMRLSRLARQPPRRGAVSTEEASTVPDAECPAPEPAPPLPVLDAGPSTPATSPPSLVDAVHPVRETSPGTGARFGWRLGVLALGGLALTVALWLLLSWEKEVSSEVVRATQPFMSPEPFPIQWDTFFPDVVPSLKSPQVVADAAPNGQAVAAPVINVKHSEKDMHPPQARKTRPSLMFCLSLSATAALAAGCATSPITRAFNEKMVKTKAFPDEPQRLVECPPEAVKAMKENRVNPGSFHPDAVYGSGYEGVSNVPLSRLGATMSVPLLGTGVELRTRWGDLMHSGVVLGASIVMEDRVYTRLVNYSGMMADENRQVPVCMEVWHGGKPGVPHSGLDPENPGMVKVAPRVQLKAVSKFY